MKRFARAGGVAALASALLLASCRRGDAPGRVIVFGLDGADPATIDLLLSEGKLPTSRSCAARAPTHRSSRRSRCSRR